MTRHRDRKTQIRALMSEHDISYTAALRMWRDQPPTHSRTVDTEAVFGVLGYEESPNDLFVEAFGREQLMAQAHAHALEERARRIASVPALPDADYPWVRPLASWPTSLAVQFSSPAQAAWSLLRRDVTTPLHPLLERNLVGYGAGETVAGLRGPMRGLVNDVALLAEDVAANLDRDLPGGPAQLFYVIERATVELVAACPRRMGEFHDLIGRRANPHRADAEQDTTSSPIEERAHDSAPVTPDGPNHELDTAAVAMFLRAAIAYDLLRVAPDKRDSILADFLSFHLMELRSAASMNARGYDAKSRGDIPFDAYRLFNEDATMSRDRFEEPAWFSTLVTRCVRELACQTERHGISALRR